jgi:hypothetical protein
VGKAYKPPTATYDRQRFVGDHSIQRFRERIVGTELDSRPHTDVGNALDRAVAWAIDGGKTEPITDKGEPATLVEITDHVPTPPKADDPRLYVVVKNNSFRRSRFSEAVVTVLTHVQVEKLRRSRWKEGGGDPFSGADGNPAFAGLAGMRRELPAAGKSTASANVQESGRPVVTILRRTSDAPSPKVETSDTVLITWKRHSNPTMHCAEYVTSEAKGAITRLADDEDVVADSIRVWVEKPLKIKRETKVELDL